PRQRDLGRRRFLPPGDPAEQINQRLICLQGLWRETRQSAPEVGLIEGRFLVDLSREEAAAERAVRNKADSEVFQGRKHLGFGLSPPQRILVLKGGDRVHRMGATDRLHACFRKAEVLYLALLDQFLD